MWGSVGWKPHCEWIRRGRSQCEHSRGGVSWISYCSDVLEQCHSKENVQVSEVMFPVQWTIQKYLKLTVFIETQLTEVSSAGWQSSSPCFHRVQIQFISSFIVLWSCWPFFMMIQCSASTSSETSLMSCKSIWVGENSSYDAILNEFLGQRLKDASESESVPSSEENCSYTWSTAQWVSLFKVKYIKWGTESGILGQMIAQRLTSSECDSCPFKWSLISEDNFWNRSASDCAFDRTILKEDDLMNDIEEGSIHEWGR